MPTVLITGANRGIGLEFARQYAADGWKVLATCRAPETAKALEAITGDVTVIALDINNRDAIRSAAERLETELNVLIANAGVYGPPASGQSFGSLDYDGWAATLQTNLLGAVATLEAFAPRLSRDAKAVAISSQMGSIEDASSGSFAYRTSKAALNMAMTLIGAELAPRNIAVATLHPGWVQTDMGGPNAAISTETSVSGLRHVIATLKPATKAPFLNYAGKVLPW